VKIEFIAGFASITSDPTSSRTLYLDRLGLSLKDEDGYLSTFSLEGAKHFGVWPLSAAAQSCFGSPDWPRHLPVPQATLEFELSSSESVQEAVQELKGSGQKFIHESRLEPWGQTVARFLSPESLLIGLSYAPWLHVEKK
jgi:catechol 2,3-dioxygenase-like lactoylglutathione lyase family enzyme